MFDSLVSSCNILNYISSKGKIDIYMKQNVILVTFSFLE